MARGNSKGILRDRLVREAITAMNGAPFTAGDLLDHMTYSRNMPSVREVGGVLSQLKRSGEVIYVGETGSRVGRELLEAAGLTQHGVRKTALYIAADAPNAPRNDHDDETNGLPANDEE
jgi:hypothetical protein